MQTAKPIAGNLRKKWNEIDIALLLFIVTAVNVKLYLKLFGIIAYLLYVVFYKKYNTSFKVSGFLKFYLLIPIAGVVSGWINNAFGANNYIYAFCFGCLQWGCAAAICYLIHVTINNTPKKIIQETIKAFFTINAVISISQLLLLSISIGRFPYWFTDDAGLYGVSTGDYITGIFQSSSVTNASVCMLGAIYFVYNKNLWQALVCMLVSALATSNAVFLVFLLVSTAIILFGRVREIRVRAIILVAVSLCLYLILSPNNITYIKGVVGVSDDYSESTVHGRGSKDKSAADIYGEGGDTKDLKEKQSLHGRNTIGDSCHQNIAEVLKTIKRSKGANVSIINERATIGFFNNCYDIPVKQSAVYNFKYPLKMLSLLETKDFIISDWRHALFGAGMANFSSKLAVKATGLGMEGNYPAKYIYVSKPFLENHLYLLLYIYTLHPSKHSTINMPHSVYNQLAGEYGMVGIVLFLVCYLGYVLKYFRTSSICIFLVFAMAFLFGLEYWFEQMSLTVLFELFIMKEVINGKASEGD